MCSWSSTPPVSGFVISNICWMWGGKNTCDIPRWVAQRAEILPVLSIYLKTNTECVAGGPKLNQYGGGVKHMYNAIFVHLFSCLWRAPLWAELLVTFIYRMCFQARKGPPESQLHALEMRVEFTTCFQSTSCSSLAHCKQAWIWYEGSLSGNTYRTLKLNPWTI